jgi:energy-coupling factor transporter ATP-binding protein EcfA2
MSCSVRIEGVTLDYFIYSVKAQSLRNAVFNLAVGGNLYKSQGDVTVVRALENVSLSLEEGDRLALVGHNGSGKTSLLKVIAGVYEPPKGRVEIRGKLTSMIAHGAGTAKYSQAGRYAPATQEGGRIADRRDRRIFRAGGFRPPSGQDIFVGYDGAADVRLRNRIRGRHPGAR